MKKIGSPLLTLFIFLGDMAPGNLKDSQACVQARSND
jgi:hypothetical protein